MHSNKKNHYKLKNKKIQIKEWVFKSVNCHCRQLACDINDKRNWWRHVTQTYTFVHSFTRSTNNLGFLLHEQIFLMLSHFKWIKAFVTIVGILSSLIVLTSSIFLFASSYEQLRLASERLENTLLYHTEWLFALLHRDCCTEGWW